MAINDIDKNLEAYYWFFIHLKSVTQFLCVPKRFHYVRWKVKYLWFHHRFPSPNSALISQ